MATLQQDINVRINAALNGIPAVQTFVGLLQKIKDSSNTKVNVGVGDPGQVNQLAAAVDNLSQKVDKLDADKPSKFAKGFGAVTQALQGISAGAQLLSLLGKSEGALTGLGNALTAVKGKASELWEGVSARAAPVLESVTTKVGGLAAALPLVGAGGAEAAVGIGTVAAGAGVAVGGIVLLIASIAALVAIVAVVTTALAAAIPALVKYSVGFADAKVAGDDLKQGLADALPIHDAYRKKLEESAAKSGEVGKQSRELQGLLFDLKSKWTELTTSAGVFVDQIAGHVIPILNQLLRVADNLFGEVLNIINGLDGALTPFFNFVLFNIDTIGAALVWLESRAVATAKGILAAIAVGLATGDLSQSGAAFATTFKQTVDDLDKIANSQTGFGPGGGRTFDEGGAGKDKNKKGRGAKTPPAAVDTSQSQFELDKAIAEARFNQIKDSLDRENKLVQEKYNDRKVSIADYYAEQQRIQDAALEAEIIKLGKELNAEQFKLETALTKINNDRKAGTIKTDAEAEAKKEVELNKTKATSVALSEQINKLMKDRVDLPHDIEVKEKTDTDALNAALQKQIDALDTLRGLGPLVAARQQVAEIDKLIEQFADNPGMVKFLEQWRELVGVTAQAEAAMTRYQAVTQVAEAKIVTLQEQGNKNLLTQFISAQRIRDIRLQELKQLQDVLKEQEAIATISNSITIQVKIQETKTKIEQLKNETKSLKDTIKDTFVDSATTGLTNFFAGLGDVIAGTKTLGQAFQEMALSIIQSLEQVIAKMLVMLIIQKLLGVFGGAGGGVPTPSQSLIDASLGGAATGDFFTAKVGGRIIRVAEGGHDEVVLTTDPKHRNRTAGLLSLFLQKTKMLSDMASGGWLSAEGLSQNVLSRIPHFDAGGFALSTPGADGGGFGNNYHLGGVNLVFPNVKDARGFKLNEAAINREVGRSVEESARRLRGTRD